MKKNIKQFESTYKQDVNVIHMTIYACDICNYDCFYCYNDKPRSKHILDLNKLEALVRNLCKSYKFIEIDFVGGEPTLHPNIFNFLHSMQNLQDIVLVNIYTNFSQSVDFYLKILECNAKLTLTLHYSSYENSMSFIKKLNDIGNRAFEINVMLQPKNFDGILNVFNKMKQINGLQQKVKLHLLNENKKCKIFYSQNQIDAFTKLIHNSYIKTFNVTYDDDTIEKLSEIDVMMNNLNSFKRWKCYIGRNYIYVHHDGNAYPCSTTFNMMKPLFNINDMFIEFKAKPILCPVEKCVCNLDYLKQKVFK